MFVQYDPEALEIRPLPSAKAGTTGWRRVRTGNGEWKIVPATAEAFVAAHDADSTEKE